jgi:hypothetical protein
MMVGTPGPRAFARPVGFAHLTNSDRVAIAVPHSKASSRCRLPESPATRKPLDSKRLLDFLNHKAWYEKNTTFSNGAIRLYCRGMTKDSSEAGPHRRDGLSKFESYRRAVQQELDAFERRERAQLLQDRKDRAKQLAARVRLPDLASLASK